MHKTKKSIFLFLLIITHSSCPPLPQLEPSDQGTTSLNLASLVSIGAAAGYAEALYCVSAAQKCIKAINKRDGVKTYVYGMQATIYPFLTFKLSQLAGYTENSELQMLTQTMEYTFLATSAACIAVRLLCSRNKKGNKTQSLVL